MLINTTVLGIGLLAKPTQCAPRMRGVFMHFSSRAMVRRAQSPARCFGAPYPQSPTHTLTPKAVGCPRVRLPATAIPPQTFGGWEIGPQLGRRRRGRAGVKLRRGVGGQQPCELDVRESAEVGPLDQLPVASRNCPQVRRHAADGGVRRSCPAAIHDAEKTPGYGTCDTSVGAHSGCRRCARTLTPVPIRRPKAATQQVKSTPARTRNSSTAVRPATKPR